MRLLVVLILLFIEISLVRAIVRRFSDHPLKRTLPESKLNDLVQRTEYATFTDTIFRKILRVRVPGTHGHHEVKMFIKKSFEDLNWNVTIDEFDDNTPYGPKKFTNIIATLNPNAKRRLILAAHYDSKYFPENSNYQYFLGATDSAMPCAMLIEIARVVTPLFAASKQKQMNSQDNDDEQSDVTLQMVFFDGEEAFQEWTRTDSLYGARHLAEVWENTAHPTGSTNSTMISTINALVLLDLIGAADVTFYNTFNDTSDLYERLEVIERRLMSTNQIQDWNHPRPYFIHGLIEGIKVEDDHIPFLERGVKILHLISVPFPSCWHKPCDNGDEMNERVVTDLLKIFQVFVVEYFGLTLQ